jgi:serine/threonine protein kinase
VAVLAGLGSGGYGKVVLVTPAERTAAEDNELYAMKVVSKVKQKRPKDRQRVENEFAVMCGTKPSRFLQHCHAAFESATDVFFVCDYMAGGDLFHHMVRRIEKGFGGFEESECRVLLAEVTCGLKHLHEQGFVHRDLKVENIMLDASGHIKIIDFGLALPITGSCEQAMTPTGSLSYMPPELISSGQKTGGRHTDWWAMGVLAYELMAGRTPWSTLSDRTALRQEIQARKILAPPNVPLQAKALVEGLLEQDYTKRLGTRLDTEVTGASFFAGIDWEATERGETAPAFLLSSIGPSVVSMAESSQALASYLGDATEVDPAQCFLQTGNFGVKSPWFLGVDVVTRHPAKF